MNIAVTCLFFFFLFLFLLLEQVWYFISEKQLGLRRFDPLIISKVTIYIIRLPQSDMSYRQIHWLQVQDKDGEHI